ncbi:MAG: NfeD family protein [Fibrobacterota bacterium]
MQTLLIILCILFGFGLIIADLLFIPGGVEAAAGGAFIIGAWVAAYKVLGRDTAMLLILGTFILAGLLTWLSIKFKIWRAFVANGSENKNEGFSSSKVDMKSLAGKTGEAATVLRPGGIVLIEGEKYDAVAESGFIEQGKPVAVTGTSTGQVVVKENNAPRS